MRVSPVSFSQNTLSNNAIDKNKQNVTFGMRPTIGAWDVFRTNIDICPTLVESVVTRFENLIKRIDGITFDLKAKSGGGYRAEVIIDSKFIDESIPTMRSEDYLGLIKDIGEFGQGNKKPVELSMEMKQNLNERINALID